jgi:hypothetical protein
MTTKKLTAAATVLAMMMSLGSAAFACGDGSCDPVKVKANNGWGNGTDEAPDGTGGTNNGSDDGGTAGTKSENGPATDKFEGR